MKRALWVCLVVTLILGSSMSVLAGAQMDQKSAEVRLKILPYAQVVAPANLDFGDINFADGFARRTASMNIKLYTNSDVHLGIDSAGFGHGKLDGWQQWVSYRYTLQDGRILSWHAGSGHGGWGDYGFNYTGAVITIPFEAWFQASADDWFAVQAGEYKDTLTITVSAK
jgi:spore coat protein U-like protein